MERKFLTYSSAAAWLADRGVPLAEQTLRRLTSQGRGPAYTKVTKRVLFMESDLEAWLSSGRREQRRPA